MDPLFVVGRMNSSEAVFGPATAMATKALFEPYRP